MKDGAFARAYMHPCRRGGGAAHIAQISEAAARVVDVVAVRPHFHLGIWRSCCSPCSLSLTRAMMLDR
jgi:hypothetical protein